jgi:hypothetical protein
MRTFSGVLDKISSNTSSSKKSDEPELDKTSYEYVDYVTMKAPLELNNKIYFMKNVMNN